MAVGLRGHMFPVSNCFHDDSRDCPDRCRQEIRCLSGIAGLGFDDVSGGSGILTVKIERKLALRSSCWLVVAVWFEGCCRRCWGRSSRWG